MKQIISVKLQQQNGKIAKFVSIILNEWLGIIKRPFIKMTWYCLYAYKSKTNIQMHIV